MTQIINDYVCFEIIKLISNQFLNKFLIINKFFQELIKIEEKCRKEIILPKLIINVLADSIKIRFDEKIVYSINIQYYVNILNELWFNQINCR